MSDLFSPFKSDKLQTHTRLVFPPIATQCGNDDGTVNEAVLQHYRRYTASRLIGLTVSEHCYVSETGRANRGQLSAAHDSDVDGLSRMVDLVHENGSKIVIQISHAGRAEVYGGFGYVPQALTKPAIDRIVAAFADAARRVQLSGADGVEIHAAHGYLFSQFYSPLTNQRQDEYGGDLERRIKLHLDVVQAVRQICGADFLLAMRFGVSDYVAGGATRRDGAEASRLLSAAGVDIFDVSSGIRVPSSALSNGHVRDFSEDSLVIGDATKKPVLLVGGIATPKHAEQLLETGAADLVGVARAMFSDPNWPQHALAELDNR